MARRIVPLAAASAILLGAGLATVTPVAFETAEVDVGATPVVALAGRFTDAASLVLFTKDDRLRRTVVSLEAGVWQVVHEGDVPPGTVFVDKARVAGGDRALSFRDGTLYWLDPADWTEKPIGIGALPSIYRGRPTALVRVGVIRDLNGDGADDVLLPDFDGLWVSLQSPDGGFGEPVKLAMPPAMAGGGGVTYTPPDPYVFDHDGDGRADLVFAEGDRLLVFQGDGAAFRAEAASHPLPGAAGGEEPPRIHGIADYNGDGVADVALTRTDPGDDFIATASAEFYFGRRGEQATVFGDAPDTVIGGHGDFEMTDIDGDGRTDIMAFGSDFGVRRLVSALVTRSVTMDLAFYRMGDQGYDKDPNATRRTKLRIQPGRGPGEVAQLADVNGDGRKDLVRFTEDETEIYLGVAGDELFAKRAVKVAFERPFGVQPTFGSQVLDLDGDGRDDFVLGYPPDMAVPGVGVLLSRAGESD